MCTASPYRKRRCPFRAQVPAADVTEPIMERFHTDQYPHLVEMATEYILQPGYDFGDEFDVGVGVILDALSRWLPENTPNILGSGRPGHRARR
jgi:hypothetical protein